MSFLTQLGSEIAGATWRASLLIALIFALRPLLSSWLPVKIFPWLWLMAAGKLLFIFAPVGWWSLYNLTTLGHFFHVASALQDAGASPGIIGIAAPEMPLPDSTAGETWNWASVLSAAWLLGAALLAVVQIGTYIKFHRQLAHEKKLTGSRWQPLLDERAGSVGVKTPLLIETHAIGSPAVVGLLRPQLLVPPGLLDLLEPEEAQLVFIHELSHLRRRDLWLLSFFVVARIVHWFNPLVWLAERALRVDCEAACDSDVLRLTSGISERYGRTLLRLTQLSSPCHASVFVAAISTNSNQTQRRLQMIMRYQKPASWMKVAVWVMVVGMGVLTVPNEVTAQEQPAAIAPPLPSAPKPGIALLQSKLKTIIIDKVDFKTTDIIDVIQFLQTKSKELDPDKVGVNFVLRLAPWPTTVQVHRKVSLTLEHRSLAEVLGYVAHQTHLQYSVQDYAVYLRPPLDASEMFTIRTYLVPAHFLGAMPPASKSNASENGTVEVMDRLAKLGIRFPAGATAIFLPESNKMVVRNTPEQLDLIVNLIDQFGASQTAPFNGSYFSVPFRRIAPEVP